MNLATPSAAAGSNTHCALRLTRGIAFAWVLVNAATPVLQALGWTALHKEVRPNDPLASWLGPALGWLAALALPAPLLLQALVLRRAAPALRWRQIVPAMLFAWMVGLAAVIAAEASRQVQTDFRLGAHQFAQLRWDEFAALPWMALVGHAGALAAFCMLVPGWTFARAAHVRLGATLLAAVGASMVAALLWGLWVLTGVDSDLLDRSAMNGWAWDKRASALVSQALAQAIWAAVALFIFAWAVRAPLGRLQPPHRLMLGATVVVGALLVPAVVAALAPESGHRLQLAVQRALSSAPAQDASEGEPLLRYAFSAPVRVREVPRRASLSPDGRWIIAVASDRQVIVVDAATGALAHRFADVLGVHESPDWAWSPDARWLALRTHGDRLAGKYGHHQARLRLYAVPNLALAGEYRHTGAQCLSELSVENAVLFERDGSALWLACGSEFQPTATDLLALRLDVPPLQLQAERRYGDAAPWYVRGLKEVGGSIWTWHTDQRPPYVRLRDLDRDSAPIVLQLPPADPSPQPEWTMQDFLFDEAKGGPASTRGASIANACACTTCARAQWCHRRTIN